MFTFTNASDFGSIEAVDPYGLAPIASKTNTRHFVPYGMQGTAPFGSKNQYAAAINKRKSPFETESIFPDSRDTRNGEKKFHLFIDQISV